MAYLPKLDWKFDDTVTEKDLNRIEGGIEEALAATDLVDQKDAETLNEAKKYTDQKTVESTQSTKQYTEGKFAEGKQYTDQKVTQTLDEAKKYADQKDSKVLSDAKQYADQKGTKTLTDAKQYTDQRVGGIVSPVKSVNGKTGDVILMAKHVGAPSINDLRAYALKGEPAGQYTPTFLNGWYVQAGEVKGVCYYKDQFGYVHLYGTCSGTKTEFGTPLFNLPAGFRPSGVIRVGCLMINFADYSRSVQFLGVYPSGEVLVESYGLPGFVSFTIFPSTFYGQR